MDGPALGYTKNCGSYILSPKSRPAPLPTEPAVAQDVRLVMIGGIFSQCINKDVNLFANTVNYVKTAKVAGLGSLKSESVQVSGYSSSDENAKQIVSAIDSLNLNSSERLVVVGYSKGISDLITALALYPTVGEKVDAVISVAGVVLGSPLAENKKIIGKILQLSSASCRGPDGQGLESITPVVRQQFLKQHSLPKQVKYYSLVGAVPRSETSLVLLPLWDQASMATGASDGQVSSNDAVLPGSTLLGHMKADHWAIAMPFITGTPTLAKTLVTKNQFPREVMFSTALEVVLAELAE